MGNFCQAPKGSTIYKELAKGRVCERTGHRGRASIRFVGDGWEVTQGHRDRHFRFYPAAIAYFNACVGYVKALHPKKEASE